MSRTVEVKFELDVPDDCNAENIEEVIEFEIRGGSIKTEVLESVRDKFSLCDSKWFKFDWS